MSEDHKARVDAARDECKSLSIRLAIDTRAAGFMPGVTEKLELGRLIGKLDAAIAHLASLASAPAASVDIDAAALRLMNWPLPKDFSPDCGISFDGRKDDEWNKNKTWPIGTNLFTVEQAKQMLEYALAGAAPAASEPVAWQASDSGHSYISHVAHECNASYQATFTIPLYASSQSSTSNEQILLRECLERIESDWYAIDNAYGIGGDLIGDDSLISKLRTTLYTSQPPSASSDEQDARRYRWLRIQGGGTLDRTMLLRTSDGVAWRTEESLDTAIDAALSTPPRAEAGGSSGEAG